MQLGETIATYDVALALRGESGKFDVTSPSGEVYHITCNQDQSITNLQWAGNGSNPRPFLIRKVTEPVSSALENAGTSVGEEFTPARIAKAPFLINTEINTERNGFPFESKGTPDIRLEVTQADPGRENLLQLDLLCWEVGGQSQQPAARVSLSDGSQPDCGKCLTSVCITFNEFDAEIRRLHAKLDEIRYRARKKFYQAQRVAPGA